MIKRSKWKMIAMDYKLYCKLGAPRSRRLLKLKNRNMIIPRICFRPERDIINIHNGRGFRKFRLSSSNYSFLFRKLGEFSFTRTFPSRPEKKKKKK